MFGRTFYHDTLRKYVILFGTLFNDIQINREDTSGNVKQVIKVPLAYGPREKFLARIDGIDSQRDPQEQPFSIVLPRMGFEVTGFNYAPERKLPTRNKFTEVVLNDEHGKRKMYRYNPVPYDISFSLSIFVKNTTDGTRIIEQILPYFTPEWTTTVQLTEDPDVTLDVPLVLTGTSQDDVYEGAFEERRALIWQLDFTMKGFFFGPTYRQGIIKLANTNIYDATLYDDITEAPTGTNPVLETAARIVNRPGLLANNQPTTYADINVEQATAVASISDGQVTEITVVKPGVGYKNATITISGGGASNTATATANTKHDGINVITVTHGGANYTSTPTVTISTPDLESLALSEIAANSNYGLVVDIDDPWPDS
jgi:hypothetical protein